MKQIAAIFPTARLYAVLVALRDIPSMPGFIVTDARGFPRGHPAPDSQSHGIDALDSFEVIKLECVVDDSLAELVVNTIAGSARTGNPRDGKIVVSNVDDVVKIRTGQHGQEAI